MKPRLLQPSQAALVRCAFATLALAPFVSRAASSNWNVDAAGSWSAIGSWDANGIPGSTSLLNSTDVATFGFTLTANRIVTVDTNRNIGGITFTGNNTAFNYTLSGGNLLLTNGGVIQVGSGASSGTHTDIISSAIAIQGDGGAATFTNNGATTRLLSIGAVTGVSTGGNVTTLTLNGTNTGNNIVNGIIGDGAGGGKLAIVKSDAGTWTLSGANTFTGGLTIQQGTVQVGGVAGLGNGLVTIGSTGKSSTLDLNGQTATIIGLATAGTAANQTIGNSSTSANAILNYTGATTSTFGGVIQDVLGGGSKTTALTLNNGAANLTLSGTNTYTGATTINAGTLKAANVQAFGTSVLTLGTATLDLATDTSINAYNITVNAPGATIISDKATASTVGINHTLGTLAIGAQQLNIRAGSNVTSGTAGVTFGATTLSAVPTIDTGASTNLTLGAISGNISFFKQGAGTLTLVGTSTRGTSTTYLNAGNLVLANTAGLGTTSATLFLGGGTTLDLATDTSVNAYPTTLRGNATILSNTATAIPGITHTLGALTVLGANTLTIGTGGNVSGGTPAVALSATTINANTTFSVNSGSQLTLASLANGGFTPTFTGAGNSTIAGAGVISGGGGLTKSGAGTLTLGTAANTYTGVTNISAGTVSMGHASSLGTAATAVLNMTGTGTLTTNAFAPSVLQLSGTSGTTIQNTSGTNEVLTVTPVANTTSSFAGTLQDGGGAGTLGVTVNGTGALTLSGTNTYTGATTLTTGRLNLNSNGALGTAALTLTTGIIDNTSGSAVALTNNNNITLGGPFTFGGSNDLSFGSGTLTPGASRTVTLMGTGKLTIGTWAGFKSGATTFINTPGATSSVSIGTFDLQTVTSGGGAPAINGNANIAITGGIISTIPLATPTFNTTGTTTLSGASSYTGATTLNAGNLVLDATGGTATLPSTNTMTLGGGTFTFKGNASGTGQTLGNITLAAGGSSLGVVGGAAGTTLTLGTLTDATNNSMLNIVLSGTTPVVTSTTAATNGILGAAGTRAGITVTSGGTTGFATNTGAGTAITRLTSAGQTTVSGGAVTMPTNTVNYLITSTGTTTSGGNLTPQTLQIDAAGNGSLSLAGTNTLAIKSGGLLYTGSGGYTISAASTGTVSSGTATNSDLIIHNFGSGGLTISAPIINGTGASVVSLDGPGTTTFSGINTYTGVTNASGGAVVSIGANSGLGAVATGAALTLNNGTLQATNTFALDNGGSNIRAITLGAGGGTFDVTGSNTLTTLGVISGTGSLTKTGSGTLFINGGTISSYSGGFTNVQNGSLQLGSALATSSLTTSTIVVLGSGANSGKLILGDASNTKTQVVAGLTTLGTGTANAVVSGGNAGTSTLTYTGTVAVPTTYNGSLGGAGTNENNLALNVTAGQLTLGGANTYVGGTTVTGGVLNLNNNAALGTGPLAVNSATAVIDNTSGSAKTLNNNVTTTTGFVFAGSNDLSFGTGSLGVSVTAKTIAVDGNNTLTFGGGLVNQVATGGLLTFSANGSTGTLSLGGYDMQGTSGGGAITNVLSGSGNITITGIISNGSQAGANANALTYTGTGVLTLSGANTYTGLTTMNNAGGILKFGAGGSLNGGAGALTITTGTVDVAGQAVTVGNFLGTAGLVTSSAANGSLTATMTTSSSANNFSGNLSVNLSSPTTGNSAANGNFYNTGDLTFTNVSSNANTLSVNGTSVAPVGNITFNANGTGVIAVGAVSLNNTGTITNSGTGSGTTSITGTVGSNVTAINNTNTSPLTISGALYVNPAGLTVTQSGTGLLTLGASTINGTGNLSVIDSSTTGGNVTLSALSGFTGNLTLQSTATTGTLGAITVSGAVNNIGLVTNSGTGMAATTISGIIGGNVTGVVQNSATSGLILTGANTFSGGLTIKNGTLTANGAGTELGLGTVTLGNTSGTAAATLSTLSNGRTYANAIVLATNPIVGALTIQNAGITTSLVTFTGGVTGNNNLVIANNAGTTGTMTFSTNQLNNAGTVTSTGTSTGATTISGGVGPNVTAITQNSATSPLTISTTALTVNGGGTTLTNNNTSGTSLFTVSGGVNGTGNLVLNNNSAIANGITFSTLGLNNTGTITNSGTGSGAVTISSVIGINVTGVVQNSATSDLILTASNTFTSGLLVKKGNVQLTGATNTNSGSITLGDSAGGNNNASILTSASQTFTSPIILAANTTGTLTVGILGTGSVNVIFSGGVTGANNITFNDTGTGNITVSTAAVNNAGTISNVGNGSGALNITAAIGSNVTGLTLNSSTSAMTASGGLAVNSGGTTLTNNNSLKLLTVSGAVTGTGNLLINNNGNLASGITVSNTVNNIGSITNSGTGTAPVSVSTGTSTSLEVGTTISGAIGSNVSTVTQNSAGTPLLLGAANTFTGSATILSGALVLGNVTAASSSQILLGNTSGSANASLLIRGVSITQGIVANNVLVQAGNSGVLTIGTSQGGSGGSVGSATLSGLITLNKDVTLSPYNSTLTLSGAVSGSSLTGVGGINIVNGGLFTNSSGQTWGIGGANVILSTANTYQGDTKVLSGSLQVSGPGVGTPDLATWLGSSTNDVFVGDTSGYQSARLLLVSGFAGQTFSKNITIQSGSGGLAGVGINNGIALTTSGNITLNKSGFLYSSSGTSTFSGNLVKGAGAIGAVSVTSSGLGTTQITGTGNNYDGGTVVGGSGILIATGAGALGGGNVIAELGDLRLSDQVALASGRKIYVGPYGGLSIGSNTAGFASYLASVVDGTSSGGILLGTSLNNNNAITLSSFGNGNMFLGSDAGSTTYSATSLGANLDGNYRLGYGKQTLTISSNVLVGGSAKLIVGPSNNSSAETSFVTVGTVNLTGVNTYGGGTEVNVGSTLIGTQRTTVGDSPFGSATGAMALHHSTLRLQNSTTSAVVTNVGAFSFDGQSTVQVDGTTGGANALTLASITRNGNGVLNIATSGTGAVLGSTAKLIVTGGVPTTTAQVTGGVNVQMAAPYFLDSSTGNFMSYDATNGFAPITTGYSTTNFTGLPLNAIVKLTGATPSATINADTTIYALTTGAITANSALTNTSGTDTTLTISSGGIYHGPGGSFSLTIGSTTAGQRINLNFNGQEAIINATTTNNSNLTIAGNITNATGITKSGNSALILSGTGSDFVGPITIFNGGTNGAVSITSDLNLGGVGAALSNGVVLEGGKLQFNTGSMTLSSNRTVTIGANGGILQTITGGNVSASAVIIDSKITGATGGYLDFYAGNTGSSSITVTSSFTLTNTANDFVAPIFIGNANAQGVLTVMFDTDSQLGNAANSVSLLGGNSALRYTGSSAISSARGINFLEQGGGLEVSSATGSWTNSGVLAGSGLFNKMGNGELVLSGSNTYTGNTIVSAGVLNVQSASALGATTAVISGNSGVSGGAVYVQSGAALEVQGNIALGNTGGKTMYLNGDGINNGTSNGGALRNVSGTNSNTGAIILQSNTTIGADADSLTLSGVVSDAGTGSSLTKVGAGTLVLSGANTYSGTTTISAGTLQLGDGTTGNDGTIANSASIVNNANLTYNRFGSSTYSGVISGTGSLTKLGAGTQILTGTNTYTGATNVTGGTLVVNGSLANTVVTVGTGATLGGSGTFGGLTTIQSGGTLSPGNSPGLQTFSSGLTQATGSNFSFELIANTTSGRGTNFDAVNVTGGTFTLESGVTFNITLNGTGSTTDYTSAFWSTNQSWLVFQNTNAPSLVGTFVLGSISNDSLAQSFGTTGGSFGFTQTGNDVYLTYIAAAIPEPSSYAALAGALALVCVAFRRRSKRF